MSDYPERGKPTATSPETRPAKPGDPCPFGCTASIGFPRDERPEAIRRCSMDPANPDYHILFCPSCWEPAGSDMPPGDTLTDPVDGEGSDLD